MSIATAQESNRSGHHGKVKTPPADEVPVPGGIITAPPRLRRRPALVAASVAAICLGALLAVWAYTGASTSQDVLAVRATVHRGQLITRDDLMTAQIGVDPALKPLPATAADTVVGKRAAMDLAAGGLVTREDITSVLVPAKGMSLVGVSLPPALMPAAQLQSGDQVRIVATPGAQGDLATGTSPTSIGATVVGERGPGDNGQIVVDVSVPYDQAAELAARAATGKIALVLDSRER
jgi:SAF domain